jgi:hypothetical protein
MCNKYTIFFFVDILGFELRESDLLGRHPTSSPFCSVYFGDRTYLLPRVA